MGLGTSKPHTFWLGRSKLRCVSVAPRPWRTWTGAVGPAVLCHPGPAPALAACLFRGSLEGPKFLAVSLLRKAKKWGDSALVW